MTKREPSIELEIRRKGRELAAAWTRGRAAFVLDSLAAEEPLRAALVATLVHETLVGWDRYDSKWPNAFRRALLARSLGVITVDEMVELEQEYRLRFGSSPPPPPAAGPDERSRQGARATLHAQRIRAALASGEPIVRERAAGDSAMFLRLQPVRR